MFTFHTTITKYNYSITIELIKMATNSAKTYQNAVTHTCKEFISQKYLVLVFILYLINP